jgi:hypothetical protein
MKSAAAATLGGWFRWSQTHALPASGIERINCVTSSVSSICTYACTRQKKQRNVCNKAVIKVHIIGKAMHQSHLKVCRCFGSLG